MIFLPFLPRNFLYELVVKMVLYPKIITTRKKEKDGNGLSADLHQGIGGVIEKMDYMWNG